MCTSLNVIQNKIFEENNEMISDEWTSALGADIGRKVAQVCL